MRESVFVIFDKDIPKKNQDWWQQFDVVIAPESMRERLLGQVRNFSNIEDFLDTGSVQEAEEMVRKLSLLEDEQGRRFSKSFVYKGYELWWMHYDDLYYGHCLPFTKFRRLLSNLKDFGEIHLYKPPARAMFGYFLSAHGRPYHTYGSPGAMPSFGSWIQAGLSVLFLPVLMLRRPGLMVWTSDLFDPPRDHDFRMRFVYEELRKRDIPFVEFVRSSERWWTVLSHALRRHRAVMYSHALATIIHAMAKIINRSKSKEIDRLRVSVARSPEEDFIFLLATHYLRNIEGDAWAVRTISLALRAIGVRAAIILAGMSRNFHEVLACKILNIPTVGILHGVSSRYFNVYDFMPEFDGSKTLSVDEYGVWSEWWKDYYLKYSRAYRPEQLSVSGLMRPVQKKDLLQASIAEAKSEPRPIRALLVPGELSDPKEVMPYLQSIMEAKGISVYLTFRPYRDHFENWLKANNPKIIERIGEEKILLGNIHDAISECDVILGSYSTGALEALLQLKPFVFFRTRKWGDYFDIKDYEGGIFFAESPKELIEKTAKVRHVPRETIEGLRKSFFGDPYQNGSKWVVDRAEELLALAYDREDERKAKYPASKSAKDCSPDAE